MLWPSNFLAFGCFAACFAFGLLFGCSVVRRPIINLRQSMTVSGRQKCDAKVLPFAGGHCSALGLAWPDLTPVASDVTANEQCDKRRDRDRENEIDRERGRKRLSVGAQRSRDYRTLLVGFLLIGVYYLDNYTLSLAIK